MTKIHVLNPEDLERDELRKIKIVIDTCKPAIKNSTSKKAYIDVTELDSIFPSKRTPDRFEDSLMSNLRKYINAYNKKYCKDGIFYHIGSITWNGRKLCYLQELERNPNVKFQIINEADIDGIDDQIDNETIGGVPIDELKK